MIYYTTTYCTILQHKACSEVDVGQPPRPAEEWGPSVGGPPGYIYMLIYIYIYIHIYIYIYIVKYSIGPRETRARARSEEGSRFSRVRISENRPIPLPILNIWLTRSGAVESHV